MSTVTIYHNPNCSKSRATLTLLQKQDIQYKTILYLKDTLSVNEIQNLLRLLQLTARGLMRTKEPEYKHQGLDNPALSELSLIEAMINTPQLIERPIVVANDRAKIGRPPESVIDIL